MKTFSDHLTLYLNGKFFEGNAHVSPYRKGTVIMVPLLEVAHELGYKADSDGEAGLAIVLYLNELYERKTLTVRCVARDGAAPLYYYYRDGEFLDLPPVELIDGVLYVPLTLFEKIGWDCLVSDSGNINICHATAEKDD